MLQGCVYEFQPRFPSQRATYRMAVISMAVGIDAASQACRSISRASKFKTDDIDSIVAALDLSKRCKNALLPALPYLTEAARAVDVWSLESTSKVGCASKVSLNSLLTAKSMLDSIGINVPSEVMDAIEFAEFTRMSAKDTCSISTIVGNL